MLSIKREDGAKIGERLTVLISGQRVQTTNVALLNKKVQCEEQAQKDINE